MPIRLEANLHRSCVKTARERGWLIMKVQSIVNVGWPDILMIAPGHGALVWVEFKREGADLSPIQKHVQSLLVKRQQRVYTVRTVKEFLTILQDIEDPR